jgi:hypothetical protein
LGQKLGKTHRVEFQNTQMGPLLKVSSKLAEKVAFGTTVPVMGYVTYVSNATSYGKSLSLCLFTSLVYFTFLSAILSTAK